MTPGHLKNGNPQGLACFILIAGAVNYGDGFPAVSRPYIPQL